MNLRNYTYQFPLWLLTTDYWPLITNYWLLITDYWLLTTDHWLPLFSHPFKSHLNFLNCAVLIKVEPINAGHTMVSSLIGNWSPVIDDVVVIWIRRFDHWIMPCTCSNFLIRLKNGADLGIWTGDLVWNGISYFIGIIAPATFWPHEVILIIA